MSHIGRAELPLRPNLVALVGEFHASLHKEASEMNRLKNGRRSSAALPIFVPRRF